ncbi:MAG: hypothetical protein BGO01_04270 [Armatimonadetes bacterium 55-13]|nr:hypothetical protein [Armatimonadota bacterium]OJU63364.1 MAG: hypothetical protein BGO01_04270 [Armatimonadetes bacterium 55-13]
MRAFIALSALAVMAVPALASEPVQLPVADSFFQRPRIGLRLGVGNWHDTTVAAGVDVTFKAPLLPVLRFDAEAWSRPDDLGGARRGNAVSLLGMQNFSLAYAGVGLSYYFTSDHGDHRSGFGAKLLVGANFKNFYVEGSTILGPSPVPTTIWVGTRF